MVVVDAVEHDDHGILLVLALYLHIFVSHCSIADGGIFVHGECGCGAIEKFDAESGETVATLLAVGDGSDVVDHERAECAIAGNGINAVADLCCHGEA